MSEQVGYDFDDEPEYDMDEIYRQMQEHDDRVNRKIKKRLQWILGIVPANIAESIQEDIEEGGITSLTITKKKPSACYLESGYDIERYVEQHSGCCEDDYYGNIWYPLTGEHYVKMRFSL